MRILLALLLVLPLAAGQVSLDTTENRLYAYSDGALYLGTGGPGSEGIEAADGQNPTVDGSRSWTVPLPDGLAQGLRFVGDVLFEAEVGGGTGAGQVDLLFELTSGETLLAEATVTGHQYAGGYEIATANAPIQVAELPAGAPLTWTITATGSNVQMFLDTEGASHVTLPITEVITPVPMAAPVAYHEVVNGTGNVSVNGTVAVLNWTAGPGHYNITFNVSVAAGFLNLSLSAPNGTAVNQTVPTNFTYGIDVMGPAAVSLRIDGTEGVGTVQVHITEIVAAQPSGNMTESATVESTDAPVEDSPGLPFVGLLAALALALRRK